MINILAIFIGGGLGAVGRYLTALLLRSHSLDFPIATLAVNIIGSFILGFTIALFWEKAPVHNTLKIAITVGFCGGLTTFSTFSWEAFDLIKQGDFHIAFLYMFISVLTCVLAVSLGAFLSRYV
jgi:CrcB protein